MKKECKFKVIDKLATKQVFINVEEVKFYTESDKLYLYVGGLI